MVWLLLLAFCLVSGNAQSLSGWWRVEVETLPNLKLGLVSLALEHADASWKLSSVSDFFSTTWVWQEFSLVGAGGPVKVEANLLFSPASLAPSFVYSQFVVGTSVGEMNMEFYTAMLGPSVPEGPSGGAVMKMSGSLRNGTDFALSVGLGAWLPPDGLTIHHVSGLEKTYTTDPRPGGFRLTLLELSLTALSLCCGITYDFELSFAKDGFQHFLFMVDRLAELCCGISLGVEVKFGTDYKVLISNLSWTNLEGCVAIWGDVHNKSRTVGIDGFEIYGYKIHCEITECNYFEIVTAFNVEQAEEILGEDIFKADKGEDEYIKFGFCGPGCCGGTWEVGITAFFATGAEVVQDDTLFGITRFALDTVNRIMPNANLNSSFEVNLVDDEVYLSIGWEFGF